MQKDNQIKKLIQTINSQTKEFLDYTKDLNQCAYTDSMVENIIKTAKQLEQTYEDNFN